MSKERCLSWDDMNGCLFNGVCPVCGLKQELVTGQSMSTCLWVPLEYSELDDELIVSCRYCGFDIGTLEPKNKQ